MIRWGTGDSCDHDDRMRRSVLSAGAQQTCGCKEGDPSMLSVVYNRCMIINALPIYSCNASQVPIKLAEVEK